MERSVVKATHRSVIGKQVKAMRRAGQLPAVLYGTHMDPTPITLDLRDASKVLTRIASSALLTVDVDGESHLALVREKQRNFITGAFTHIDFQVVSMQEKLRVEVGFLFRGESSAVKDFNGILVTNLEYVEVEALPGDLPESIPVDLTGLKRIGDAVYVRDLVLPANVTVMANPNEVIAIVAAPAVAVEGEGGEAVAATPEPEVIEKGKKEEEEF